MTRLSYPSQLSDECAELLRQMGNLNVTRMMSHSEPVAASFARMGFTLLRRGVLDPKLREIAILTVGSLAHSDYEVHQHRSVAEAVGVDAETIRLVLAGNTLAAASSESLVVRVATEIFNNCRVSPATFKEAQGRFVPAELIELVVVCGYYVMTAAFLNTFEIEVDSGPALGQTMTATGV